ncbi:hypothetical protein BR93DRAFT_420750 [Coniochaeta sp. PMI_546]|nr:hypothetical protein BR93DRAFT_420750 [Coniochaeta sp. PMI_546]
MAPARCPGSNILARWFNAIGEGKMYMDHTNSATRSSYKRDWAPGVLQILIDLELGYNPLTNPAIVPLCSRNHPILHSTHQSTRLIHRVLHVCTLTMLYTAPLSRQKHLDKGKGYIQPVQSENHPLHEPGRYATVIRASPGKKNNNSFLAPLQTPCKASPGSRHITLELNVRLEREREKVNAKSTASKPHGT